MAQIIQVGCGPVKLLGFRSINDIPHLKAILISHPLLAGFEGSGLDWLCFIVKEVKLLTLCFVTFQKHTYGAPSIDVTTLYVPENK